MKNNFVLVLSLVLICLFSCKKENSEIKNSPSPTYTVESIIGKRWFRVTDYTVYSFELESSGKWITYNGCESKVEGSWTIDSKTSKLYHIFNGQQEEYEISEPSSTRVKFKGGQSANSQIAPSNVLLVYDNKVDYSNFDYLPSNANYKIIYDHHQLDSEPETYYLNSKIIDKTKPILIFDESEPNKQISQCTKLKCLNGSQISISGFNNSLTYVKNGETYYVKLDFEFELINNQKFIVASGTIKNKLGYFVGSKSNLIYYKLLDF